jgi:hypothetical protein
MKIQHLIAVMLTITACSQKMENALFSWGNSDSHFSHDERPAELAEKAFRYSAWKGEKISAEAVIWTENALSDVSVEVSRLRNGFKSIPAENVEAGFIGYVMSDVFQEGYGQCGFRKKEDFDSLLVADIINGNTIASIDAESCQPVWLSIRIPSDAEPGTYKGSITVKSKEGKMSLPVSFEVTENVLPEPSEWKFHLDLWQNPYSVARYHGVEPWSDKHFELMAPVMKILADAGQKVITATIMDRPWNGQTEDAFGSMVTKILKADGTWEYGYEAFDKWVNFMMGLGIDKQISCYTMIPWNLEFDYYDEAAGEMKTVKADPSGTEYKEYWGRFLSDFADHLREKGWYEKTVIAMDERPEESMKAALEVIRNVQPDFKVSLAGNWHEGLEKDLYDYCIAFRQEYPEGVVEKRKAEGKVSTFYTCCAERYPNTFMVSPHAEAVWIPWYVLSKGYDGYLRWAYNTWTADPVADARFRAWPAGDCFIVYPEGRSSIRMEKFTEGIQDYEKARILMERWSEEGNDEKVAALAEVLQSFTYEEITENGPEEAVHKAKATIDRLQ